MFESKVNKGKAWGYAQLDGTGKVPLNNLPPIQSTIDTGSFVKNNQTGSFATIGSNTFTGNQTISGSIFISGSTIQSLPNSSGDGYGNSTLRLIPDNNLIGNDQYLIIDPTAPNHIHIRAGGTQDNSNANLFLGGENSNVEVLAGQNPLVNISANSYIWQFGNDGALNLPIADNGKGVVQTIVPIDINANGNHYIFGTDSTLTVPGNIVGAPNLATTGANQFNGNQSISGSVNISSSLVVSSTFINNQTLDAINSDLIIEGGYLILTGSAVPTDLTGSLGDKKGMIAVDDNYIYYCTQDFVQHINPSYTYPKQGTSGWNDYGAIWLQMGFINGTNAIVPHNGLYFVDDTNTVRQLVSHNVWFSADLTPVQNGNGWLVTPGTSYTYSNDHTTITLYENDPSIPYTPPQIWKTIRWNPSPNKDTTIESVNYAPFGSGSFSNPFLDVTQLDINKSIHVLDITDAAGDSHWVLPDGYDGQVVKFVLKGNNAQGPNSIYIWVNNLRNFEGQIQSNTTWSPFWDNGGQGYDNPRSLATAVFVDGAWNIDSDWWGM